MVTAVFFIVWILQILSRSTAFSSIVTGYGRSRGCNRRMVRTGGDVLDFDAIETRNATCILLNTPAEQAPSKTLLRWRRKSKIVNGTYLFHYNYNKVVLKSSADKTRKTVILLIHPIGVGIGRWFYNRLLRALYRKRDALQGCHSVLAPDLLACGSACDPIVTSTTEGSTTPMTVRKLPLLTVTDWAEQIMQLMKQYEDSLEGESDVDWCVVSNGGCVPIALKVAETFATNQHSFQGNLTNMVLSAPPRLSGLLRDPPDSEKVQRSYRTLSGLAGNLFWWYALRKKGKFIQKFSERNLAADPDNLGEDWTPQCVSTAQVYNSRYSTFAFLAGALQTACQPCFDALANNTSIRVSVFAGGDKRRNPARSWFWDKQRKETSAQQQNTQSASAQLAEFLDRNGNGGLEIVVGGRRCPAHEDAEGFADALISCLLK